MRTVMLGEISDQASGQVVLTKGALYLMHDATVMWLDVVAFAGHSPSTCGVLSWYDRRVQVCQCSLQLGRVHHVWKVLRFRYESNY